MRNGSRVNPHLTLADIAARLKPLQAFGRLRRGVAVCTGRALLEA